MKIKNAAAYGEDRQFQKRDICVQGELFADTGESEILDAEGLYLIPGLIDIHIHGCVGHDFCDGTHEAFAAMAKHLASRGITAATPASMTLPEERLVEIFRAYATYESREGALICGINMEGPFFCAEKKGAQNAAYLRDPDVGLFRRLQTASNNGVRLLCVAPELPGAMELIREASGSVTVSLAHSAADYATADRAFRAGAAHVTHLFNAMHPLGHREPGIPGAAADNGAAVELICDGVHLHPAMVRAACKLYGRDKIVLVSDNMMAAGLSDGDYALGGQAVRVEGSRATLADGTIAGSVTDLLRCMQNAVEYGIPLEDAVAMATANPARAVHLYDKMGSVSTGKLANFVLLDRALEIRAVYIRGKKAGQS